MKLGRSHVPHLHRNLLDAELTRGPYFDYETWEQAAKGFTFTVKHLKTANLIASI